MYFSIKTNFSLVLIQKPRDERILVSGPGYRIRNLTGKWYPNRYPNPEIFFLVSKPVSESGIFFFGIQTGIRIQPRVGIQTGIRIRKKILVSKPVSESGIFFFGIQTGIRIRNFCFWYPNRYPNPKFFFLVSETGIRVANIFFKFRGWDGRYLDNPDYL